MGADITPTAADHKKLAKCSTLSVARFFTDLILNMHLLTTIQSGFLRAMESRYLNGYLLSNISKLYQSVPKCR